MSPKRRTVIAALPVLLLAACGANTRNLIIGRWEADAAVKLVVEFHVDGTARITMMGQTLNGTYKLNGNDELEWNMNGRTTKARLHVTAQELELTDEANRTIKYHRK